MNTLNEFVDLNVAPFMYCRPIEVKYLHCEDGRRVKPAQRAELSHWATTKVASSAVVKSDDADNVEKLKQIYKKVSKEFSMNS
ncbi:hypothetical protein CEXT_428961 [Caerostris extrusa]|uniref:Uncharacterized protein n=1 Tax=Caerostris extrusa TaxID=172846 RepID=A0AAV4RKX3_CAEEX|nr:hypothetical protein CEXT_428961 [Caerostris extrusa]